MEIMLLLIMMNVTDFDKNNNFQNLNVATVMRNSYRQSKVNRTDFTALQFFRMEALGSEH